jgi:hypothetical protein
MEGRNKKKSNNIDQDNIDHGNIRIFLSGIQFYPNPLFQTFKTFQGLFAF